MTLLNPADARSQWRLSRRAGTPPKASCPFVVSSRKTLSTGFPQAAFTLCIKCAAKKIFSRKTSARRDIGQVEKKLSKTLLKPAFCFP